MFYSFHFFPGFFLLVAGLGLQYHVVGKLSELYPRFRLVRFATAVSTVLLSLGYLLEFQRVAGLLPAAWATWIECAALLETIGLGGLALSLSVLGQATKFQSARRSFLRAAGAGACVVPAAFAAVGIMERTRFRVSEIKIPIPNLPKDLDGLRIVQVTDIHLSPFLSEKEFARAIDMANETRANLALVTGDLITRRGDPLDACLGQLARLRADSGVLGCLGNHEVYAGAEDYVTAQGRKIGIEFLRNETRVLRFGASAINFAGVDYQKMHHRYLVGAERLVMPGVLNVLLSHNPDVFPVAAAQGYDLTIAGHTHGGQINFEVLHQNVNAALYFTPYVRGLYRRARSSIYVSSGLGTIGMPLRIGAPAEVSLLRLCAI
jgi:predicted MPP superfamily phosphohydrolase